jgi:hypothetical protein
MTEVILMRSLRKANLKLFYYLMILVAASVSCHKKEDKPAEEAPEEVPLTNEIYGYFVRCGVSFQDNRGNPTSSGGGSGIRAYFRNTTDWSASTKVKSVGIDSNALVYGDRGEDFFSDVGFYLNGDSLSYPQHYYYLPVAAYTSTFTYPQFPPTWAVSGLNEIPDFTYVDSLRSPLVGAYMPRPMASKSSGMTIAFMTSEDVTVRLELRDDNSPSANKYVTSIPLHPHIVNNTYVWDSVVIAPSKMGNLVAGKTDASVFLMYEKSVIKRISRKNFKFSLQSQWEFIIDIKQ